MPAFADSYQPSLLEKFFSAPISVLYHLLLVSSADNLFKQLEPRSDYAKLSCENGLHVKSPMSLRCWRGKFFLFLSAHFCCSNSLVIFIELSFLAGICLGYVQSHVSIPCSRGKCCFFSNHLILSVFFSSFLSTIICSVLLK